MSVTNEVEPLPEQGRLTLSECVARWTKRDLDRFYRDVDIDLLAPAQTQESHWLCRTPLIKCKNRRTGEMTPMYRVLGRDISRQRIALILAQHEDPGKMTRIRTRCGVEHCINPYHLSVKQQRNKRH